MNLIGIYASPSALITRYLQKPIRHPLKNSDTDYIEFDNAADEVKMHEIRTHLAKHGKMLIM